MSQIKTKYIADNQVTNAKLSQVSTSTIKGRTTAGTGNVEDLTATQATALLNNVVGDSGSGGTKGLVPAPGAGDAATGKFLKADGTFAVPAGSFSNPMTTLGDIIYENSSPAAARLAGNTTTTKKFLTQTGNGSISAVPGWNTIASSDLPTLTPVNDPASNFVGLTTAWVPTNTDDINAETSVGNWVAYADSAAVTPVDMTGGSPNTTIARTTTSGEVLNGTGSFKITKSANNRQGEGVSCVINVPIAYQGKKATIKIPWKVVSGSLVSGDVRAFIYDVTNSILITPYNNDIVGTQGTLVASFDVTALAASPANLQLRVGFHFASTSATAVTLSFDDVYVGPETATYGMAASDWTSYSLTIGGTTSAPTLGTTVINSAQWRRVGDSMEIKYQLCQTGAGSAGSGTYLFPLPSGYTIDTSKMAVYTTNSNADYSTFVVGSAIGNNGAPPGNSNNGFVGSVIGYNTTNLAVVLLNGSSNGVVAGSGFLALSASNMSYSFEATVPISGWSSNITVSSSSTFRMSSVLASGTRVTATPTSLGQYRAYKQNASARTGSDAAPTTAPSAANGMALGAFAYASAGSGNFDISRYEIFIGTYKNYKIQFYSGTGFSGTVDATPAPQDVEIVAVTQYGVLQTYDPSTGVLLLDCIAQTSSVTANRIAISVPLGGGTLSAVTTGYFDIIVSENAQAVGVSLPTINYFNGHFDPAATWSTTSTTFVDGTNSGGNTLTTTTINGMTVTAAASNACGITWTPPSSTSAYRVSASLTYNIGGGGTATFKLTDGTTTFDLKEVTGGVSAVPLDGIFVPGTTSPVTLKVQIKTTTGTVFTECGGSTGYPVTWNIFQIR